MQDSLNAETLANKELDRRRRAAADPFFLGKAVEQMVYLNRPEPRRVSLGEVTGATIESENFDIFGLLQTAGVLPDLSVPGYDPLQDPQIQLIPEEDQAKFAEFQTPEELERAIARYQREYAARSVLSDAGLGQSLIGGLGAALVDPLTYAELVVTGGSVRAYKGGKSVLSTTTALAGRGAAAGLVEQGVTELSLANRFLRTDEERALSIGASAVFGGILGGAGGFINQARVNKAGREMIGLDDYPVFSLALSQQMALTAQKRRLDPHLDEEELVNAVIDDVLAGKGGDFILKFKESPITALIPQSMKNKMKWLGPGSRMALSDFEELRTYLYNVSNLPYERVNVPDALKGSTALETAKYRWMAHFSRTILDHDEAYRKTTKALNRDGFDRLVSEALRRGDEIDVTDARKFAPEVPEDDVKVVNELVKRYREADDDIADLAERVGAFENLDFQDGLAGTAPSHWWRQYDRAQFVARREDFRQLLRDFHGGDEEIGDLKIDKVIDKIMGIDNGGLHANVASGDPFAARTLMIPDAFETTAPDGRVLRFSDFLVNNPKKVLQSKSESIMPKLLHAERFATAGGRKGSEALLDSMKKIGKKINELSDADHDEAVKLAREIDEMLLRAHDERVLSTLHMGRPKKMEPRIEEYSAKAAQRRNLRRQISEIDHQRSILRRSIDSMKKNGSTKKLITEKEEKLASLKAKARELSKEAEALNKDLLEIGRLAKVLDEKLDPRAPRPKEFVDLPTLKERFESKLPQVQGARRAIYNQGVGVERFNNAIDEHIDDLIKEASQKKQGRLEVLRNKMKTDLEVVHRRFLGMPSPKDDPEGLVARGSSILRTMSILTKMGGVAVSSIADIALGITAHGFRPWVSAVFKQGADFRALAPRLRANNRIKDDIAQMVYGYEVAMGATRMERLAGFDNIRTAHQTGLERGLQSARKGFGGISIIQFWNSRMRMFSATQAQTRLMRDVDDYVAGKLDSRRMERLAQNRITEDDLKRWATQIKKWREDDPIEDTPFSYSWPQAEKWSDIGARQKWEESVLHFSNQSLIDVGVGDLPNLMDNPVGAALLQFKSFAISTTQRTLITGLQRADREYAQGMLALFVMGGMTHILKEALAGRDAFEESPTQFAINAVDRSGMLGMLTDVNAIAERMSLGHIGLSPMLGSSQGVKRYSERNLTDALLGPTFGTFETLVNVATMPGKIGNDEFGARDVKTLRRSIPYQNLFYTRLLMDRIERAAAEVFE